MPPFASARRAAAAAPAQAQQLATRAALDAFLGATAVTEPFDDVPAAPVSAIGARPILDATTAAGTIAAGKIAPGIGFANQNNGHWFWSAGYAWFGNTTTVYSGGHNTIDLLLSGTTRAFGLDMWLFAGQTMNATLSLFDAGDRLVGSVTMPVVGSRGNFVGWRHDAGIARVRVSGGTNDATSVRMDDVTFGAGVLQEQPPVTATPEPATYALMATGLAASGIVARRRRTA